MSYCHNPHISAWLGALAGWMLGNCNLRTGGPITGEHLVTWLPGTNGRPPSEEQRSVAWQEIMSTFCARLGILSLVSSIAASPWLGYLHRIQRGDNAGQLYAETHTRTATELQRMKFSSQESGWHFAGSSSVARSGQSRHGRQLQVVETG